jgi:hypothetical protein
MIGYKSIWDGKGCMTFSQGQGNYSVGVGKPVKYPVKCGAESTL